MATFINYVQICQRSKEIRDKKDCVIRSRENCRDQVKFSIILEKVRNYCLFYLCFYGLDECDFFFTFSYDVIGECQSEVKGN